MELDMYRIGRRIAGKRVEHGWTQQQLADRAGVTQRTIALLETGKRHAGFSVKTLVNIAEALGVGVEYVLFGTEKADSDLEPAVVA